MEVSSSSHIVTGGAIDGDDEITDFEVDLRGGRSRIDPSDDRRLISKGRGLDAHHVGDADEEDCGDDIGHRTRKEDQGPFPAREELDLLGGFADNIGLIGAEPEDPDIAPERDERDAVVGPPALEPPEPAAETNGEDLDGRTEETGHTEMTGLVDDHQDTDDEDERGDTQLPTSAIRNP